MNLKSSYDRIQRMKDTDLLKLCALSRIDIKDEEIASLSKDLDAVLEYVGKIKDLELPQDIEQSFHTVEKNIFREDSDPHPPSEYSEALLKNAPEKENSSIKVKNIL